MDSLSQGRAELASRFPYVSSLSGWLWIYSFTTDLISFRFSLPVSGNCHLLRWSCLTWMRRSPLRRHGLHRLPISVSLAKFLSVFFCEFYLIVNF